MLESSLDLLERIIEIILHDIHVPREIGGVPANAVGLEDTEVYVIEILEVIPPGLEMGLGDFGAHQYRAYRQYRR